MQGVIANCSLLFEKAFGIKPESVRQLPVSGSPRRYFRLIYGQTSAIGAYSESDPENRAFISFTEHFRQHGLAVPEILGQDPDNKIYLLQDLGDKTLLDLVVRSYEENNFDKAVLPIYEQVIADLVRFQVDAGSDLDYSLCYPRKVFDKRSMMFDLDYFKYYFLKPSGIDFSEQLLEDDFQTLAEWLALAPSGFFMYRDFQARNIMIHNGKPWYIDYQGGYRGALQYDLAALLFQAKARLQPEIREHLLNRYVDIISEQLTIDRRKFISHYWGFTLIRLIQVLGAYGFRGLFERKSHFLQSIPPALENVQWFIENAKIPVRLPEMYKLLERIIKSEKFAPADFVGDKLNVLIRSFSFRKGIPGDPGGNGGGYVFDCRALPNPFRVEELRYYSGTDEPVIDFFKKQPEMDRFIEHVSALSRQSVNNYLQRGFTSLMISFGCTGGQHRSVYCAERLAKEFAGTANVRISLVHDEKEHWILKSY